jgi:hypothetical protein
MIEEPAVPREPDAVRGVEEAAMVAAVGRIRHLADDRRTGAAEPEPDPGGDAGIMIAGAEDDVGGQAADEAGQRPRGAGDDREAVGQLGGERAGRVADHQRDAPPRGEPAAREP